MTKINTMTLEHINDVSELERKCFYIAWTKADFVREIAENKLALYLVAESENKVVGYAGMWHIVDEGHITNIAVLPEKRRCGIGSKLVKGLIDIAIEKKINALTLEVKMSNLAAQKLYTNFGFKPEGIRKRYYHDTGEDAIIMWKRI